MRLSAFSAIVLTIVAAQVFGSMGPSQTAAILSGLGKLTDTLQLLLKQASTPEDHQRLSRVSELVQSLRIRLMNGRIDEKSPQDLLKKLEAGIQVASPQKISTEFSETLNKLLSEATGAWEVSDTTSNDCVSVTPAAPEVVLNELTSRCTKGGEFHDVLGCVGAATLYCHRAFPHKSDSELLGLVTDRKGDVLTVKCLDRSRMTFSHDATFFFHHIYPGNEQIGADSACRTHYGPDYAGIFADRVTMKTLGETADYFFMGGCFIPTKRVRVAYSLLQTEDNKECRAGNPVKHYGCLKGASRYCQMHFGYSGGVVQSSPNPSEAEVACYNAFFTNDVHIARDDEFFKAKNSLEKICSLEMDVDRGKILQAVPDILATGSFDNRKSDAEQRNTFTVKKSVTTENQFSHSHSFSIGAEISTTIKIPFVGESKIKVSASYTAEVSLTKTNSKTDEFEHATEVVVPPRKYITMKAVVTRTKIDVPWRAVGITKLGKRVELSGTWVGVDVSDFRVELEDL